MKDTLYTYELDDLIVLIQETLERCQRKFANPESGSGPSCILSLRLHSAGRISGYYLPILSHWGWNEYDHLVYGDGGLSLPFSHEDTWQYLTDSDGSSIPTDLILGERGNWKAIVGGIRVGQVFFVRNIEEYRALGLNERVKGGFLHRGPKFVASKMKREWQEISLPHSTTTCAFCTEDVNNPIPRGDFIVFDNRFKPHPWHKVIVPGKSLLSQFPSDSETQLLSPQVLRGMLQLLPELWEQKKEPGRVLAGIHFGVFSGQTMSHPHLHARQ